MGETKAQRDMYTTQIITKHLNESTFTLTCSHRRTKALNLQVNGVLIEGQPYTHPLISLDLRKDDPYATPENSRYLAWKHKTSTAVAIQSIATKMVENHTSESANTFATAIQHLPRDAQ